MELSKQAKEELRAYKREWYSKNKEKAKEYRKRYWERKAEQNCEKKGNQNDG